MTSRIRDLTRTYDWYIYHGHINGKKPKRHLFRIVTENFKDFAPVVSEIVE